jgi:hypothetical protein
MQTELAINGVEELLIDNDSTSGTRMRSNTLSSSITSGVRTYHEFKHIRLPHRVITCSSRTKAKECMYEH